jgi:hypothetical protein
MRGCCARRKLPLSREKRMARPGLEPGTPRFSAVGQWTRKLAHLQGFPIHGSPGDTGCFLGFPAGLGRRPWPVGPNPSGVSGGVAGGLSTAPAVRRHARPPGRPRRVERVAAFALTDQMADTHHAELQRLRCPR